MDNSIISALISLGSIGVVAAIVLYFVAQKFKVIEDPKIDEVDEVLPGANCGGCGYAGCRAFAEAMVKAETMDGFYCPVGGNDLSKEIAPILGVEAVDQKPQIAVLLCHGSIVNSVPKFAYDGPNDCKFTDALSTGEGGCPHGCLGGGDCVDACDFDAMYMDKETNLPVVKDNCIACNACVIACPRDLFELRNRGPKDKRIFVSCKNEEKGGPAKKNCSVACIGCSKCLKECKFDAIVIKNFLAYIDYEKCTLCRKCVPVCPTNAIHEINFKPRKPKLVVKTEGDAPVKPAPKAAPKAPKEVVAKEEAPVKIAKEAPKEIVAKEETPAKVTEETSKEIVTKEEAPAKVEEPASEKAPEKA